jgi:MFS family permease
MPIFAGSILHGGPNTLGFLMGASGVGALVGAVTLAARKTVLGLGRLIPITAGAFGASLIAFALSRHLWLSLLLLVVTGFGFMQQMASSNTILQTIVEDEKRGRVMSFYSMAFQGVAPFGSLIAGAVAMRLGAPATLCRKWPAASSRPACCRLRQNNRETRIPRTAALGSRRAGRGENYSDGRNV